MINHRKELKLLEYDGINLGETMNIFIEWNIEFLFSFDLFQ